MPQQMNELLEKGGLTSRHERVPAELVLTLLRDHYNLDGTLHPIDTEKDTTFRLSTSEGDYLVKVSPPDEPLPVVHCQTEVIGWVQQTDPGIPVQAVQRTREGEHHYLVQGDNGEFLGVLRVLEFIPGTMLGEAKATPDQLRQVGAMLGRVGVALQDFDHEGLSRHLVWNIGEFLTIEPLLEYEKNPARRAMAEQVFKAYREQLEPVRHSLRSQTIHGDFSAFNAVVNMEPGAEEFVTGVIDFGDVQRSPVIFDPAVLFANHLRPAPANPWQTARDMLVGYLETFPLTTEEIRLLPIASLARVTLRALVTNWRVVHVPERADYLLEHAHEDWERIENTLDYGLEAAQEYLLTVRDPLR